MNRVIITGHPMTGKSTNATKFNLPVFCTDPKSKVREPQPNVTYMPEGLTWTEQSDYAIQNWMNGQKWCIEGVGAVRLLRKWASLYPGVMPADQIYFLHNSNPQDKHLSMTKAVNSIWGQISGNFAAITQNYYEARGR